MCYARFSVLASSEDTNIAIGYSTSSVKQSVAIAQTISRVLAREILKRGSGSETKGYWWF